MKNDEKWGKVVDSGFDYLTLTVKPNETHYNAFKKCALEFVGALGNSGVNVQEASRAGYDGYEAGETFFGTRKDGAIWRTSGATSRWVACAVKSVGITPRVTRADLQRTLEQPDGGTGELDRIIAAFDGRLPRSEALRRQKFAAFYDKGIPVGSTFGARSSTSYLRCYRADLRHPEKFDAPALRFECEWKAARANQVWAAFELVENDATLSASFVGSAFAKKGITHPICSDVGVCPLPPLGRSGNDAKTVYWIQNTVCKIIARLVRAGFADELRPHLLAALNPLPETHKRSTSLEADTEEIDWELLQNG
jgi:hypothetical protein